MHANENGTVTYLHFFNISNTENTHEHIYWYYIIILIPLALSSIMRNVVAWTTFSFLSGRSKIMNIDDWKLLIIDKLQQLSDVRHARMIYYFICGVIGE